MVLVAPIAVILQLQPGLHGQEIPAISQGNMFGWKKV
jgi:hypothetical protein